MWYCMYRPYLTGDFIKLHRNVNMHVHVFDVYKSDIAFIPKSMILNNMCMTSNSLDGKEGYFSNESSKKNPRKSVVKISGMHSCFD